MDINKPTDENHVTASVSDAYETTKETGTEKHTCEPGSKKALETPCGLWYIKHKEGHLR